MPYRRRGSSRRRNFTVQNKNVVDGTTSTGTTRVDNVLELTVDSALNTVQVQAERGSFITSIWLSFDVCGLAATGVLQRTNLYMMKDPGTNLTPPGTFTVGTSNEKRFVIKQWQIMTMRNQDGNVPFHWEGWIKIPRQYQRNAADDRWLLPVQTDTAAGHMSFQAIYKWKK